MTQKRRAEGRPKAAAKPRQASRHAHAHVHEHEHGACGCEEPDESQTASSLPMERLMRVLRFAVDERNFATQREVEDFLAGFSEDQYNEALARLTAAHPREQAQQLAYEAIMDAENDEHAVALAERALALDPDCIDAKAVLAEIQCTDREEHFVERLKEIVDQAAGALGPRLREKHETGLWTILDARPFLRAKFRLGDVLRATGGVEAAAAQFEELLALNPEDQQAAREPLLACYLALGKRRPARKLLDAFPFDESAVFHWGRVLECVLAGDNAGAVQALAAARGQNPHVEPYLAFRKKPPKRWEQGLYTPGDREEAIHCLYVMGTAFASHPEAVEWLRAAD